MFNRVRSWFKTATPQAANRSFTGIGGIVSRSPSPGWWREDSVEQLRNYQSWVYAGPFLPPSARGLVNSSIRIWTRGPRVVQVVYVTATGQVPNDVKEAYARLVGCWYRKVKTDAASNFQDVAQQKYGDTFVIFSKNGAGFPQDVLDLLGLYRTPEL